MQLSNAGLKLTENSEGCRLIAYRDTGGVLTIGYGHTKGVREGQTITQEIAETLLAHDELYASGIVNAHCLPCTQGQFDALTDFVFNVGPSQFLSSHLFAFHKSREYDKAAAEFPKWKYDNGKVEQGLVVRRAAEQAQYTRQEQSEDHPHIPALGHSESSVASVASASPDQGAVQSSPVQPAPTVDTAPASNSEPSGFVATALALLSRILSRKVN